MARKEYMSKNGRDITLEEAFAGDHNPFAARDVNVPQKPLALIPMPGRRPADWIKYEDVVAFVEYDQSSQRIFIGTGHICSWPGSHGSGMEVDNIRKTVVYSDEEIREVEDFDLAHEESFDPQDACLVRLDEVDFLRDPERAVAWFQGVFPPEVARQISALFCKSDFGRAEREEEKRKQLKELNVKSELNVHWWKYCGRPAPKEVLDNPGGEQN